MTLGLLLGKSLEEILALDAEELLLWQMRIQTSGPDPYADRRAAMIAWTMAAVHGSKVKLEDFLPTSGKEKRSAISIKDPMQMRDVMKAWCIGAGGTINPPPTQGSK